MSVFVKSLIQKPQYNFWKYCNNIDINYSYLQLDQKNKDFFDQNVYQYFHGLSNGLLIHDSNNKKIFVVSSMKSTLYEQQTIIYFKINKKIVKLEVNKICDFPEFDMTIFSCKYNNKLINYCYDLEKINYSIYDGNKITINSYNYTENIESIELDKQNYQGEIKNISFENLESKLLVRIPIYDIHIDDIFDKAILNGSTIINNNNEIIGMISDFAKSDGKIYGVPSYCIRYIIDLVNNEIELNLKTFIVKSRQVSIENETNYYDCHYIEQNYGIKSERIIPEKSFIFKVNNEKFNDKGMLFCSKLNYHVPFETYILLHNEIMAFTLDIMYNNDKQTMIKINISPIDYKKYLNIPVNYNPKCLIVKGMVFIEASEEYLKSLPIIEIDGSLKKIYEAKYSDLQNKTIILVDILFDKISDELAHIYRTNKLPIINIEKTKYYIPICKKIHMHRIKSFDMIKEYKNNLSNAPNIILQIDKNKEIKLSFNLINTTL